MVMLANIFIFLGPDCFGENVWCKSSDGGGG